MSHSKAASADPYFDSIVVSIVGAGRTPPPRATITAWSSPQIPSSKRWDIITFIYQILFVCRIDLSDTPYVSIHSQVRIVGFLRRKEMSTCTSLSYGFHRRLKSTED